MNRIYKVYPVNGGLEDWAYAGSWENATAPGTINYCKPYTPNSEFPATELEYSNSSIRSVMYLIETATNKQPEEEFLGDSKGIEFKGLK